MYSKRINFTERGSLYAIYLVIVEALMLLLLLITHIAENFIDPYNDLLFAMLDDLKGSLGFIAIVVFPLAAFVFSWIGRRSSNRNRAVAGIVLATIGLIPLVGGLLLTIMFRLAFRGMD